MTPFPRAGREQQIAYDCADDAVRSANDSVYGLAVSVWTRCVRGIELTPQIRTGTFGVNWCSWIRARHLAGTRTQASSYMSGRRAKAQSWSFSYEKWSSTVTFASNTPEFQDDDERVWANHSAWPAL
jgi:Aldehyde dehydrogenase family